MWFLCRPSGLSIILGLAGYGHDDDDAHLTLAAAEIVLGGEPGDMGGVGLLREDEQNVLKAYSWYLAGIAR
jgi:hypothetical protein